METHLAQWLVGTEDGEQAEQILRKCVHCGFCAATCPTYQILGDELDGPRGRIYLIKQVVEGAAPSAATQQHLDRCLTCRNCESTCPSGVQYGHLVDIGRKLVSEKVKRPLSQRVVRTALREGLTRRWLFEPAMALGKMVRPVLPSLLRSKVPAAIDAGVIPKTAHTDKVLILNGCVQPAMNPAIDASTIRVLDKLGVQVIRESQSGCCGAIRQHLDDHDGALRNVRNNIDAWWPHIEAGVDAIVMNASGCGAMVSDYAHLLRNDPAYQAKAARVSELTVDLAEYIAPKIDALEKLVSKPGDESIAFHPPCTLQHGQQVRGVVESILSRLGVKVAAIPDSHLCCGSAGTYSITQPELSKQLRDRKITAVSRSGAKQLLSANIGCLTHLQSGTDITVRHWIEWLDESMR